MNTIMLCGNAVPLDKERGYFLDSFISNVCRCVEGLLPKAELMELYEIDDASWAKHIAGNKLLHRMVTAEAARRIANGVADYERHAVDVVPRLTVKLHLGSRLVMSGLRSWRNCSPGNLRKRGRRKQPRIRPGGR
jgi:hypothetical protein